MKTWKKWTAMLGTVLLASGALQIGVWAADRLPMPPSSGKCGPNLTWYLDFVTDELVIEGTGGMYDYWHTDDNLNDVAPWRYYDSSFDKVVLPDGITSIGDYAFYSCDKIQTLEIPDTVTRIGEGAMNNLYELTEVTVGKSVATIEGVTFLNCARLVKITVDPANTAYRSTGSELFTADGTVLLRYAPAQSGTVYQVPDTVTRIADDAFQDALNLTKVTLSEGLTRIGNSAFSGCQALKTVEVGNALQQIGEWAFSYCESLERLSFPDTLTQIDEHAFYNCLKMGSVELGSGVKRIGDFAFMDCISLEEIDLPEGVTTISNSLFYNCANLERVTFGENVDTIEESAFYNCESLSTIDLSGISKIGKYAFRSCNSLTSLRFDQYKCAVGDYAFAYCEGITEVAVTGRSITFGEGVFTQCFKLSHVTITAANIAKGLHFYDSYGHLLYYADTVWLDPAIDTVGQYLTERCPYWYEITDADGTVYIEYSRQKLTEEHEHTAKSDPQSDEKEHWSACAACGETLSREAHVYDNDCDKQCNVCQVKRLTTHRYGTECHFDASQHWYICTVCESRGVFSSHHWDEGTVIKEPTVAESGERLYTCQCGASYTEEIPQLIVPEQENVPSVENKAEPESDSQLPLILIGAGIIAVVAAVSFCILLKLKKRKKS